MARTTSFDPSLDDGACLAAVALGGAEARRALAVLYGRYAARFRHYFRSRYRMVDADADDLVQDVFVRLVQVAGRGMEVRAAGPWIWRVAINSATDRLRRSRLELSFSAMPFGAAEAGDGRDELPAPGGNPADEVPFRECVQRAFVRFARDHPERAQTLEQLVLHGWSTAELAEYLGRTEGAAREFLSQCRKRLRAYVAEACREDVP